MKKHGGGLQTAGEIIQKIPVVKRAMTLTPSVVKLLNAAQEIHAQPDAAERAYMARQLVFCTLPHTDPGNKVPVWSRKSGASTLSIQPGFDENDQPIGFPYGSIPRLLLFWITTEVQRSKNVQEFTIDEKRTLHLGRSLNDFMREVGLNPATGGGKRGDGKRLHSQMQRLFTSRISFIQTTEVSHDLRRRNRLNMDVAPQSEFWWDIRQPEQGALWQSWIKLGEDFYNALVELPVPVDMRALRALKRSPLALDLYAWVCYRAFVIVQKNQPPQFMSWEMLSRQLGGEYGDLKNFKKKAVAALRKVKPIYPGLSIGEARGGFTIHATRLAVPQKDSGKVIGQ